MLQRLKDYAIAHGMESWARPLWSRLVRQKPDPMKQMTLQIIQRYLRPDSVCLDVGCHKGIILDAMILQCPQGTFHAFEPVPDLAAILRRKYRNQSRVIVHELAASAGEGTIDFFVDIDVPGRSGLRDTSDFREKHRRRVVTVRQAPLDSIVKETKVDFVKIDVEGAEFSVLQGGTGMYRHFMPLTVFEHSVFSANHFDTKPADMFHFFAACGMVISTMPRLLAGLGAPSEAEFAAEHLNDACADFVAYNPALVASTICCDGG